MRTYPDRGSILVEVVFLLVLLTMPVFYLVATLGRLQAGAYAVSAATREAGRAFVTADDGASASARAASAAQLVLDAHGFGSGEGAVTLVCGSDPCLQSGGQVQVRGSVTVELPLVPDFLAGAVPTRVQLTAAHLETVDDFREP